MPRPLVVWLVALNAAAFVAMGLDKAAARRGARRLPENTLHAMAAAGGFLGTWTGARAFRHKTLKTSFRWRHALSSLVGAALLAGALWVAAR